MKKRDAYMQVSNLLAQKFLYPAIHQRLPVDGLRVLELEIDATSHHYGRCVGVVLDLVRLIVCLRNG